MLNVGGEVAQAGQKSRPTCRLPAELGSAIVEAAGGDAAGLLVFVLGFSDAAQSEQSGDDGQRGRQR